MQPVAYKGSAPTLQELQHNLSVYHYHKNRLAEIREDKKILDAKVATAARMRVEADAFAAGSFANLEISPESMRIGCKVIREQLSCVIETLRENINIVNKMNIASHPKSMMIIKLKGLIYGGTTIKIKANPSLPNLALNDLIKKTESFVVKSKLLINEIKNMQ